MNTKLLDVVVLCEKYDRLVAWYRRTLAMKPRLVVTEGFQYTELQRPGLRLGFAPAEQMGAQLPRPRHNAVLVQLTTPDVRGLMRRVKKAGGTILFGPSRDTWKGKPYWYGAIADIEGNPIWVIDLR